MTNQDIAIQYLERFCLSDIDGLEQVLAPDLKFTGTFHTYHARAEYLESLRKDPPEPCAYHVLSVTENQDSVAVFYEYQKPELVMNIAQLFKIKDGKIQEVFLVFDGRGID